MQSNTVRDGERTNGRRGGIHRAMWFIGDRTLYSKQQWNRRTMQSNSKMTKDLLHQLWRISVSLSTGKKKRRYKIYRIFCFFFNFH